MIGTCNLTLDTVPSKQFRPLLFILLCISGHASQISSNIEYRVLYPGAAYWEVCLKFDFYTLYF